MWPWGHLAVGYLAYRVFAGIANRWPPTRTTMGVLIVSTQLPDLVDKPLAYSFSVLPEGRALMHSLLVALPVCLYVLALYGVQSDTGRAFTIGYLSHLLGDSYRSLLAGQWADVSFLLWPLYPPPDYSANGFGVHWEQLLAAIGDITVAGVFTGDLPMMVYQVLFASVVVLWWLYEGAPGIRTTDTHARDEPRIGN